MFRQQRDDRRLGKESETLCRNQGEERRPIAETEKSAFAGAYGLPQRGEHGACGFGKFPLGRHLRSEIGERFDRAQKPSEVVFLHCHAKWKRKVRAS
ncbi:MAG: hypothetical protein DMG70_03465 [Acidobacteria bacterium]|nr:MAG: hypothetical protein DMG70_03465 [Acidobacteriota bacterium]